MPCFWFILENQGYAERRGYLDLKNLFLVCHGVLSGLSPIPFVKIAKMESTASLVCSVFGIFLKNQRDPECWAYNEFVNLFLACHDVSVWIAFFYIKHVSRESKQVK